MFFSPRVGGGEEPLLREQAPPPYAWNDWKWREEDGEVGADVERMRRAAGAIARACSDLRLPSPRVGDRGQMSADLDPRTFARALVTEVGALRRADLDAAAARALDLCPVRDRCAFRALARATGEHLCNLRAARRRIDQA